MPQSPKHHITVSVGHKALHIMDMIADYSNGTVPREETASEWLHSWSLHPEPPPTLTDEPEDAPEAQTEPVVATVKTPVAKALGHCAEWANVTPEALASAVVNQRGSRLYDNIGSSRLY